MLARLAIATKAIAAAIATLVGQWGIIWADKSISLDEFTWAWQIVLPAFVAIATFFSPKNRERKTVG